MNFLWQHHEFIAGVLAGSTLELLHIIWLYYRKTHPPIRLKDCSVLEYLTTRWLMLTEITSSHTDSDKLRMRNEVRQQLFIKLADKEYRDIFVDEQINTGLAFQIRGLREQRNWSQAELGKRAGMAQSRISVMEDANYSRFSLSTLKRLASAFDVGLTVKFSPYGKLVEDFIALDSSALNMCPHS